MFGSTSNKVSGLDDKVYYSSISQKESSKVNDSTLLNGD